MKAIVLCAAELARCACMLERDHEGAHVCDCDGSWRFIEGKADFFGAPAVEVVRFPGPRGMLRERDFFNTVLPE